MRFIRLHGGIHPTAPPNPASVARQPGIGNRYAGYKGSGSCIGWLGRLPGRTTPELITRRRPRLATGDRWNARFALYAQGVHVAADHPVEADNEQKLDELVVLVAFGEGVSPRVGQSVLRRQLVCRTEQQRVLGTPMKVGVGHGEGQRAVVAGCFP